MLVAVVLAAGAGSRFHGPAHKLATPVASDVGTRQLVEHAIVHARDAGIGPVVVVTGAAELDLPAELATTVTVVRNPSWADGQHTSLAAGIDAAGSLGADAVVVGLGDQPGIPSEAWRRVALAPTDWPVVVASYDGRRGPHPVRLHRSIWPELASAHDGRDDRDDGARRWMREHPDLVHEVPCPGTAADIDTLEDVQRWKSS